MTIRPADRHLHGHMLIGSHSVPGSSDCLWAVNPRTGERLEPPYAQAGPAEVQRATSLAWEAFPAYRSTQLETRAAFLESIATSIEQLGSVLVDRIIMETGLPQSRVESERARTTHQLRLFADLVREGSWLGVRIDPGRPDRTPTPKPDLRQRRIPLGPVAVFGASNFPLAFSVAGGDTASALAAGAPVVVKAHEAHPGTSELVACAIQRAVAEHDLPEGTFSLLHGSGPGVGVELVKDPRIKAVGFTGSRRAGLAIQDAAARRPDPIPVFAEMSSVNPVFLLPHALERRGAELAPGYIASVTNGAGQFCTNPGLVFALESEGLDHFIDAAAANVRGRTAAPMLTSGIRQAFEQGADRLAALDGVVEVARGEADPSIAIAGIPRLFVTDASDFARHAAMGDEVFGATSLIIKAHSADQLVQIAERVEGQLTATIHAEPGEDDELARRLLTVLEVKAGRIVFDGWPTGVEVGHAVIHGGPFPATTDSRTTSVGSLAVERFLRPVSYQDLPEALRPAELDDANPLGLWRRVDGALGHD